MILRNPDGTFTRATDVKQVDAACAVGATMFKIITQAPNTPAFTALLDRALDRPKEQKVDINVSSDDALLAVLESGRKYAAGRNRQS